jgi:hypothetical protein
VFREHLRDALFPSPSSKLAFLSAYRGNERWLLLNCLQTISGLDEAESVVLRDGDGRAFMVEHLVTSDETIVELELFVLRDSNRGQLFCTPSFRERAIGAGVEGIEFTVVGRFEGQLPQRRR